MLERANGNCERCEADTTFIRVADEISYLEVHHKIRIAGSGGDNVKNAIQVCLNCYRELHYGFY